MLEQVINHGTGEGARKAGFLRPAAGKTGTTNDSKDAWFAGFTPNLLAVVWTGFDQKEALGLTGAEASLPAWTDFMKAATAPRPELDFPIPPGIVVAKVDPSDRLSRRAILPGFNRGRISPKEMAPSSSAPSTSSAAAAANPTADHGRRRRTTKRHWDNTQTDSPND